MAAKALFGDFARTWWVAGGWAIDLHLGRQTRDHHDLDVGLFARDQVAAHEYLSRCGWELHCADPPGRLRPWPPGEELPPEVHDIWCRRSRDGPWELQLMLNPGHDGHWISRRDRALRCDCSEALLRSPDGIAYLAPHLQLHFKAKGLRPRDEADLRAVLPQLHPSRRAWLRDAIARTYGAGHPWLATV
jgi:hypothetical protein